jgi:hypothetical protein
MSTIAEISQQDIDQMISLKFICLKEGQDPTQPVLDAVDAQSKSGQSSTDDPFFQAVLSFLMPRILSLFELAASSPSNVSTNGDLSPSSEFSELLVDMDELKSVSSRKQSEWWTELTSIICDASIRVLDSAESFRALLKQRSDLATMRAHGFAYMSRLLRSASDSIVTQRLLLQTLTASSALSSSGSRHYEALSSCHPLHQLNGSSRKQIEAVNREFVELYSSLVERLVDPRLDIGQRLLIVDRLSFQPRPTDLDLLVKSRTFAALIALERECRLRVASASTEPFDSISEKTTSSSFSLKLFRLAHARLLAVFSALAAQVIYWHSSHFLSFSFLQFRPF